MTLINLDQAEYKKLDTKAYALEKRRLQIELLKLQEDVIRNFLGLLAGCLLLAVITFYLWKKCLFEKYGAYMPLDKNIEDQ